jgi:ABC-type sugar transport system permease subunit
MRREARTGIFFISPGMIYFLVFWITPVILAIFYGFTDWSVGKTPHWIWLKNYTRLFTDPLLRQSLIASAKITLISVSGTFFISLGLASLLNTDRLFGGRLIRVIIILPFVADWVATGLVWQLIFLPNGGVLAGIFSWLGLHSLMTLRWTSSARMAPWAISIFIIWKTTGLYTIIFLAGLKGIPKQYAEAAQVDGANIWQSFWNVTFPLLKPITVFVLMMAFVSTIGLFEPVYMLTGGGPADATRVLPIYLYENFFQFHHGGYASAAGILFLFLCLGFALAASRLLQYSYYE